MQLLISCCCCARARLTPPPPSPGSFQGQGSGFGCVGLGRVRGRPSRPQVSGMSSNFRRPLHPGSGWGGEARSGPTGSRRPRGSGGGARRAGSRRRGAGATVGGEGGGAAAGRRRGGGGGDLSRGTGKAVGPPGRRNRWLVQEDLALELWRPNQAKPSGCPRFGGLPMDRKVDEKLPSEHSPQFDDASTRFKTVIM